MLEWKSTQTNGKRTQSTLPHSIDIFNFNILTQTIDFKQHKPTQQAKIYKKNNTCDKTSKNHLSKSLS